MEIALILDRFDSQHGGLEHWAFQYASWLNKHGHRVHIVAAECAPEMNQEPFMLHPLGPTKSRVAFASTVERYLRQLQPEIVHDLGSGWYFDILQPQFGSRLADARQNLRTLPFLQRLRKRFSPSQRRRWRELRGFEDRQYGAAGGRVIAVSKMTREHLRHFNHVPGERVRVVHNGVDTGMFRPSLDGVRRREIRKERGIEDKVVLLLVAHNFRLKGLDTLFGALVLLRADPVHALVVGRGEWEKYQAIADARGVRDKITFCRFVDDIREYYHAADICVHPTFYDPCSLAVLEALACGLPVITTRCNGASELIEDGVQGFILENPASAVELARAIRRLTDIHLREQMRKAARGAALRQNAEKCFEHIVEIYRQTKEAGQGRDSGAWA
jgi:UDP-glucose:(heptosyl)LPS alpha-1,3-glucosyltransferase